MGNSMQSSSAQDHESCGNLFLRKIRRLIPINFWQEVKSISKLALPVVISITGTSVGIGLATACDTLISQTFGSKNLKRIGVILQRGILILSIACFPCWAIFINVKHILLACRQSPAVANLADLYVLIFIPGIPAIFLYQLQIKYLQNQGITMPQVFTGLIANIINAIINYIFIFVLKLGVQGSAAANVISQYCQTILLFGYIRWKKLYVETWAGWTADCLQEWDQFTRLAIPSLLMLCIEWWAFDIGTFLAGLLDQNQLGAQTIVFQIELVQYLIPLSYGMAATVRVGNALGASDPEQAVNSAKVALCCIVCIALVIASILLAIKNVVGYIFTNDKEIAHLVSQVIPLNAAFYLIDSIAGVSGGVLRGVGKQKLGAIGNLIGFYVIGLPIGISLMFKTKLGIIGLWTGMLICVVVQVAFFLTVIYRIDWNKATEDALVNAGVMRDVQTSTGTSAGQTQYLSTGVDTGKSAANPIPNACELEPKVNNGRVSDKSSILGAGVTTVGEILTTKQLIIRRGLAFLTGPLILAIGLAIHFSLEKGS
ncbi:multidrug and toxin extrusion protein 1-like isoform X2 [Scyliorhinus torazame]|uniref:multidrug and toxin extrusion protein 1-like isoform X2 n=1 Tax=Scyliorhinus torazame TaxID=75743 RepID=UPI003B598D19